MTSVLAGTEEPSQEDLSDNPAFDTTLQWKLTKLLN